MINSDRAARKDQESARRKQLFAAQFMLIFQRAAMRKRRKALAAKPVPTTAAA
jgi:hypothetical protein